MTTYKRIIDPAPPLDNREAWTEFLKRWCIVTDSGCWEWQRGVTKKKNPYGVISIEGRVRRLPRVVFQVFKGPMQNGPYVCHTCDNPRCANPDHLYSGTNSDNMKDCAQKGRISPSSASQKLTSADVIQIRELHLSGVKTGRALASQFGVAETTIYDITNGRSWTHIAQPGPPPSTSEERVLRFIKNVSRLAGRVPGLKHLRQEAEDLVALLAPANPLMESTDA